MGAAAIQCRTLYRCESLSLRLQYSQTHLQGLIGIFNAGDGSTRAFKFIGLMTRFKTATREDLNELLRTPTIKALVGKFRKRLDEQLEPLINDDSVTH